jgi:hypothetical protein
MHEFSTHTNLKSPSSIPDTSLVHSFQCYTQNPTLYSNLEDTSRNQTKKLWYQHNAKVITTVIKDQKRHKICLNAGCVKHDSNQSRKLFTNILTYLY